MAGRENAQSDAERIMERLEDERAFVPDCREARIAMTALIGTIVDPAMPPRCKVEAGRQMACSLEFSRPCCGQYGGAITAHLTSPIAERSQPECPLKFAMQHQPMRHGSPNFWLVVGNQR